MQQEGQIELVAKTRRLQDLKGMLPYKGPRLTNKQIVEMAHLGRDEMAERIEPQVFSDPK